MKIQQLWELESPLLDHNPEWFQGDGFQTQIIGYGIHPHWVSFFRQNDPPEKFDDHSYWICGEIVRKWEDGQWKITGRLKIQ